MKWANSNANKDGFKVTNDNEGRNLLTGQLKDGNNENVHLKMIEIYEVKCIVPPK